MKLDANQNKIDSDSMRILVIDDTRLSQHVIQQRLMDNGYTTIEFAESARDIRHRIKHYEPHVIILDWMMPGINGLSLTKMIRAQDKVNKTHTYVLMVTGKDSEAAMVQAFREGVNDFIAKADVAAQLAPRMIRATGVLNDWLRMQSQLDTMTDRLRNQAKLITVDPVSQLPSRQSFATYFNNALNGANSRNYGLTSLLICIANYTQLAQKLPPKALNQVVKLFSDKLSKQLRPTDFVARTDTAEFVALLQTTKDCDINTLDRIERALDKLSLKTKDGFHILEVKTASAKILTDAFAESWSEADLRHHLSGIARASLPISSRIRCEWPEVETREHSVTEYLFSD